MLESWTRLITKEKSFNLGFKALFILLENNIRVFGRYCQYVFLEDFQNHVNHIHNLGLKHAKKEKEKKNVFEEEIIFMYFDYGNMCALWCLFHNPSE